MPFHHFQDRSEWRPFRCPCHTSHTPPPTRKIPHFQGGLQETVKFVFRNSFQKSGESADRVGNAGRKVEKARRGRKTAEEGRERERGDAPAPRQCERNAAYA